MAFGEYIKEMRNNKKLSSRELAGKAGISQAYLSQLETGKNKNPTAETISKLAKALEVDYTELLFQTELVQKTVEEKADEEVNTIIENYNRYRDIKGLTVYDEYTFKIERLFDDTTTVTYKDVPLNIDEKKELLNFVDYLFTKRNNEK